MLFSDKIYDKLYSHLVSSERGGRGVKRRRREDEGGGNEGGDDGVGGR